MSCHRNSLCKSWRIAVGIFTTSVLVEVIVGSSLSQSAQIQRYLAPPTVQPSDDMILEAVEQSLSAWQKRRIRHGKIKPQKPMEPGDDHIRLRRDEEVACYDHLGCFRDEGPFDYLDTLPLSPDLIQTSFLLFTRQNPTVPVLMDYINNSSLYAPQFNASRPIKLLVHGFSSSCRFQWAYEIRDALLNTDDVNVICVDWEKGAEMPNYVQAAANTRLVGRQIALFILRLNAARGTNNTSLHLIGFSMGAHVAGFAGNELQNVSRITGLDPAAPLFEGYSVQARLDPSDADFVDVIHSNGDSILHGGLGAFEPLGHVDYYPNGGREQLGCSNIFVGAISDLFSSRRANDGRSLCNHRRAYKLFVDSTLPACTFPAFECENFDKFLKGDCFPCATHELTRCGYMGYYADRSQARGKLYLLTRDSEPFCANQFKITVDSEINQSSTYGSLQMTLIGWNNSTDTFILNSDSEPVVAGKSLARLVVASPELGRIVGAQLKYMPYKGWLTSGLNRWAIKKITITHSMGSSYYFCGKGLTLMGGHPVTIELQLHDCRQEQPSATWPSLVTDIPTSSIDNIDRFTKVDSELNDIADVPIRRISTKPEVIKSKTSPGETVTSWQRHGVLSSRRNSTITTDHPPIFGNSFQRPLSYSNFRNNTAQVHLRAGAASLTKRRYNNISKNQPSINVYSYERLGRNMGFIDEPAPLGFSRSRNAPDIPAQIVFIPRNFRQKYYIPVIRSRSNSKGNERNKLRNTSFIA